MDVSFPGRSKIISKIIDNLKINKEAIIKIMMEETGRKKSDCIGEFEASIVCAEFYLGEGLRLYSNVRKSFDKDKLCFSIRKPYGVALLIVASNTPLANISWKFFPAYITGNKIILKGSEDVPKLNDFIYKILLKSGVDKSEIVLIQGSGLNLSNFIIRSLEYDVISFTGSSETGSIINNLVSSSLKKISLELGGKNSIYIDHECDINNALDYVISSSFSNAGQRCASSSKLIIHKNLYNSFKKRLIQKASKLSVGNKEKNFLGPVINKKLYERHKKLIIKYKDYLLVGRKNLSFQKKGFFIYPTIIEIEGKPKDLFYDEIFGPIVILIKAKNLKHAVQIANDSKYGLTSSIHTNNIQNMKYFMKNIEAGVCNVNTGTHGSEPHFPFGGVKNSGNGTREPGETAIDIYSYIQNVSIK